MVNQKWAMPLNFQLKLARSPKWNRDGSCCTMRLYCVKFLGKNHPQSCNFGITLKLQGTLWSVAENFNPMSMTHQGHDITRPADELMFEDQETTSQTHSDKEADVEMEAAVCDAGADIEPPPASLLEEASAKKDGGEMGLGLFNYLESYRKRLEEM